MQQGNDLDASDRALARSIAGFAKYLLHGYQGRFFDEVEQQELSFSQLRTLFLLSLQRDEGSLKQLADELGLSLPAVSRSIEGLVRRALVTRTEDSDDRRLKRVRVTDAGRAVVDRLIDLRISGLEDFVRSLPANQRARLAAALAPIVSREDVSAFCVPAKEEDR